MINFYNSNSYASYIAALSIAVSVLGWIVVFRQTSIIKYRDDVKVIVQKSEDTVNRLFDLAKYYYQENDEHIGFASADIRANFLLLSHYLILLRHFGLETKLESYVVAYRSAIMGGYFETTDFKKQLEIPDKRSDISNTKSELNFRINKSYFNWTNEFSFTSSLFFRRKK